MSISNLLFQKNTFELHLDIFGNLECGLVFRLALPFRQNKNEEIPCNFALFVRQNRCTV